MVGFKSPLVPASSIDDLTKLPEGSTIPDTIEASASVAPSAANITKEYVEGTSIQPSQAVYWTYRLKGSPQKAQKVTFYIHGGGNTTNSPASSIYIPRFEQVLKKVGPGFAVIAPAYRLATSPENAFPASHQDIFAAWQEVVGPQGYKAEDIIVAGDSSGGNLGEHDSARKLAEAAVVLTQPLFQPLRLPSFLPSADRSCPAGWPSLLQLAISHTLSVRKPRTPARWTSFRWTPTKT